EPARPADQLRRRRAAAAAGIHGRRQEDPGRGASIRGARRAGQTGPAGRSGPGAAGDRLRGSVRAMTVQIINGPNLGRLGQREPAVYGSTTHDQLVEILEREAAELGL